MVCLTPYGRCPLSIINCPLLNDPLFHPGWIAFNEAVWGLQAERKTFGPERGTSWELEVVVYRDKKGRLVHPPRNPYLPVDFRSASDQPVKMNRRKRMAIQQLADFCSSNKVVEKLEWSPELDDPRPFAWNGLTVEPRFTWYVELDDYWASVDPSVRQKVRKAEELGYRCEQTTDWQAILECLEAPEDRKGFSYRLDVQTLSHLHELTPDQSTAFLCTDSGGNPVAGRVMLYAPGGTAIDWSAGVKSKGLRDGVNALLQKHILDSFVSRGCTLFNFAGANIPAVAEMKEAWGGYLVPYYNVSQGNLRTILRDAYVMFRRRRDH